MRRLHAVRKLVGLVGLAIAILGAGAAWYESNPDDQTVLAPPADGHGERGRQPSSKSIDNATLSAAAFSPVTDTGENPLAATRIASLTATQERPLFSSSRRPPPQAAAPARPLPVAVEQPPRPPLTLVGVVAAESDGFAIFLDEKTKAVVRLKRGESYSGWVLQQVRGREATLERGSESEVIAIVYPAAR